LELKLTTEYIEPTPRGRLTLIILYICIGAWYVSFRIYVEPMLKYIASTSGCEAMFWVRHEVVYFCTYAVLIILLSFFSAYKLLKYNQIPYPSAYVLKRTPIVRGIKVKLRAAFWLAMGLLLSAAVVYFLFYFRAIDFFTEQADISCAKIC